ncbi:MAG: hypothetical protein JXA71_15060 [Chitinispirillaceae bacterium]|nr:hypothetical protein [Chitinispirillaceae bacterium]
MHTDIRFPIGLLFTILGVLITIFGLATQGGEIYKHSLGININLWSGVCLTVFGAIMLAMALNTQKRDKAQTKP